MHSALFRSAEQLTAVSDTFFLVAHGSHHPTYADCARVDLDAVACSEGLPASRNESVEKKRPGMLSGSDQRH